LSIAKKFAGQTAIYGISTIAGRVLNFFLTPVYTRAYVPGVYGVLTTLFSWASILNAVMAFGMETTFFRYLNKYENDRKRVYNNAFASVFTITILFLLLTIPFIGHIANFINVNKETSQQDYKIYIEYFITVLVIDAWCVIPFAKLRAEGKPGKYSLIKFINVIVFIFF